MKKRFVLVILMAFLCSGCGSDNKNENINKTSQKEITGEHIKTTTAPKKPENTPKPEVIGEFSTRIVDKAPERLDNLKIACNYLSKVTVKPQEEFSFNNTLGARTEEKGYKKGYVFEGTEKVEAIGGGICQISSTLFNAVKNAGFKVIERHPHKRKVDYVARGKDATVSYGELDFKFVNNKDYTVKIEAYITDTEVVIRIWKV